VAALNAAAEDDDGRDVEKYPDDLQRQAVEDGEDTAEAELTIAVK
jgi:hypothetical protein